MKGFFRWVWSLLEFIIIVYVIALTAFILCKNKYGYTQFGDYTFNDINLLDERNIQNTKKGDLLVVKNSGDISKGDVIYYYTVYNENWIVKSNPVIDITEDDFSAIYTVMDKDEPTSIQSSRVLGKYATTFANLGSVIGVLESRLGFLFLVLLPIMIVFIYQVYEFIVIIRYEKVEDEKESLDDNDKKEVPVEEKIKKEENSKENPKKEETVEKKDDIEIL